MIHAGLRVAERTILVTASCPPRFRERTSTRRIHLKILTAHGTFRLRRGLILRDNVRLIGAAKNRVRLIHLKDGLLPAAEERGAIPHEQVPFRPLGQGDLDLPRILDAALDSGVESLVVRKSTVIAGGVRSIVNSSSVESLPGLPA